MHRPLRLLSSSGIPKFVYTSIHMQWSRNQGGTGPLSLNTGALPPYFEPCNLILELDTC